MNVLSDYFRSAISKKVKLKSIVIDDLVVDYTTNVLSKYIASNDIPTLFDCYSNALASVGRNKKINAFKELGDVSLFMSSAFIDRVKHTGGVRYYVDMGRMGYSYVASMTDNELYWSISAMLPTIISVTSGAIAQDKMKNIEQLYDLYEIDGTHASWSRLVDMSLIPVKEIIKE